jgi:hypothetical protein
VTFKSEPKKTKNILSNFNYIPLNFNKNLHKKTKKIIASNLFEPQIGANRFNVEMQLIILIHFNYTIESC